MKIPTLTTIMKRPAIAASRSTCWRWGGSVLPKARRAWAGSSAGFRQKDSPSQNGGKVQGSNSVLAYCAGWQTLRRRRNTAEYRLFRPTGWRWGRFRFAQGAAGVGRISFGFQIVGVSA